MCTTSKCKLEGVKRGEGALSVVGPLINGCRWQNVEASRGCTSSSGRNGEVRLWFSGFFVLNGVSDTLLFVLDTVSLQGLMP